MHEIYQTLILGVIQGISEFLPISSSGHLKIIEELINIPIDNNKLHVLNVILHTASLFAVLLYFRKTWLRICRSAIFIFSQKGNKEDVNTLKNIIISTIPLVVAGLTLPSFKDISSLYISICFLISGFALYYADRIQYIIKKNHKSINNKKAFLIGLSQVLAILPGISRSGISITAAMLTGLSREKAAEYSFLLSVPAISGASILAIKNIIDNGYIFDYSLMTHYAIGFITSFISSILCIHLLLSFIKKHSFSVFSYYLLFVGIIGILINLLV